MSTQIGTGRAGDHSGVVSSPEGIERDSLFDELEAEEGTTDDLGPEPHRRRVPWLPIVLALIGIGAVFGILFGIRTARQNAAKQTQYKVAKVDVGEVKKTVTASGTLQPWSTVDIKSKAGGRVNQLLVNEGDIVHTGQVIARIDPSDTLLSYQQSQADVDSAHASIAQNQEQYSLQVKQSAIAIETARAQLANALAAQNSARVQIQTARTQAQAQPTQTAASIRQAQANYDAAVKDRQQLDATQPQDKALAQASYDQAVADYKNAQADLTRQQALLAKGFVAQQVVDQAQAAATSASASVSSAKAKLDTIDAAQRAARASSDAKVSQARAALQNAQAQTDVATKRNALQQAQAAYAQAQAQVQQAQAALDQAIANQANNAIKEQSVKTAQATAARAQASLTNAKTTLDQTTVRAPENGVVLQKYVEQGTIITSGLSLNSTGTSIIQLGNIDRMYVDVQVDETDIASVNEGQSVDISFDAYPGVPFEGKVYRIEPQAQLDNNVTTVHVRVEVDNSEPSFRLLKPGMNATCEFIIDKKEGVIAVPNEAVHEDDQGSYVQEASGGKVAPTDAAAGTPADPNTLIGVTLKRVSVEPGLVGNDTTEITKGLSGGETIVVQSIEPEDTSSTPAQGAAGSPFGGGGMRGGFGGGGGRSGGGGGGSRGGR